MGNKHLDNNLEDLEKMLEQLEEFKQIIDKTKIIVGNYDIYTGKLVMENEGLRKENTKFKNELKNSIEVEILKDEDYRMDYDLLKILILLDLDCKVGSFSKYDNDDIQYYSSMEEFVKIVSDDEKDEEKSFFRIYEKADRNYNGGVKQLTKLQINELLDSPYEEFKNESKI